MNKIIIISYLLLALIGFQVFNSVKKTIEHIQEKRQSIYAELEIDY